MFVNKDIEKLIRESKKINKESLCFRENVML